MMILLNSYTKRLASARDDPFGGITGNVALVSPMRRAVPVFRRHLGLVRSIELNSTDRLPLEAACKPGVLTLHGKR
jgi:hypothetical protein